MSREEKKEEVGGWSDASCADCSRPFPQRHSYERRCPVCYKIDKGYNLLWGDLAFLWAQEALHEAQEKLPAPKEEQVQERFRGKALTKLIFLCHPDKHGGKAAKVAEEVTKKLLAIRVEQRSKK